MGNTVQAQIEVHNNNHVVIGNTNASPPTKEFLVTHDVEFKCEPATSGIYFQNFQNNYEPSNQTYNNTGSTTYNEPSIVGQWGNAAWLGTWQTPFWQVRSFEVWVDNVYVSSDSNFKENIMPLLGHTDKLMQLRPVSYDHFAGITDNTPIERAEGIEEIGKNKMGLLAQELATVYPELVHDKGNGELAVDYIGLIPVLIKVIQEQQADIDALKAIVSP